GASSTRHAEIEIEQNQITLRDLDSCNGTTVNGASIKEHSLANADVIEFGRGGPQIRVSITLSADEIAFAGTVMLPPTIAAPKDAIPATRVAPSAPIAGAAAPTAGIGKVTLERRIETALARERARSRSSVTAALAIGMCTVVISGIVAAVIMCGGR